MPSAPRSNFPSRFRVAHRIVLGLLVLLCGFIALQPSVGPGLPPASLTVTALVLALGLIFARSLTHSPTLPIAARPWLASLTLVCALGVGATGLAATALAGAREAGLGFALGGLILALRGPTLESPSPTRR